MHLTRNFNGLGGGCSKNSLKSEILTLNCDKNCSEIRPKEQNLEMRHT